MFFLTLKIPLSRYFQKLHMYHRYQVLAL